MANQVLGIPYKKANITNVSNDGRVLTLDTVVGNSALPGNANLIIGADADRMITIVTGRAKNSHRWIRSATATAITTTDPWGVHWFRGNTNSRTGDRFSEEIPEVGDEIIISYNTADLVALFPNEVHLESTDADTLLPKYRVGSAATGRVNGNGNRVRLTPASTENGVSYNEKNTAIEFDSRFFGFDAGSP